jgi:hypothetical protein
MLPKNPLATPFHQHTERCLPYCRMPSLVGTPTGLQAYPSERKGTLASAKHREEWCNLLSAYRSANVKFTYQVSEPTCKRGVCCVAAASTLGVSKS